MVGSSSVVPHALHAGPLLLDEPSRAMVLHSAAQALDCANFTDLDGLAERLHAFIDEWNQCAHPFQWTRTSFDKVLAKIDVALAEAA